MYRKSFTAHYCKAVQVRQCNKGIPLPTAPRQCSTALYPRSSNAHCPQVVRQCTAGQTVGRSDTYLRPVGPLFALCMRNHAGRGTCAGAEGREEEGEGDDDLRSRSSQGDRRSRSLGKPGWPRKVPRADTSLGPEEPPPCTPTSPNRCSNNSSGSNLSNVTRPNRSWTPCEGSLRCREARHRWQSGRVR